MTLFTAPGLGMQGLRKLGELYTANFAKYANGGGFVSADTAAAITAAGPKLN